MHIINCHHVCIQTNKYEESISFYTEILNFEIVKSTENFHGRDYNTWLKASNILIELQTPKKNTTLHEWSSLNSGPVHIAFVVSDVYKAFELIKNKGYSKFKLKNQQEIYQVNNSMIFKVIAPEGTEIEIRDNPNID